MKRAILAVLAALFAGLIWVRWPASNIVESQPGISTQEYAPPAAVEGGLTVVRDSDFDRLYGAKNGTAEDDLKQVAGIWDAALLLVKDLDRYPLPDNAAITAFLQGKNPHRVAWIRPGHPAVSPLGELLDRWGSPVFFHRESARVTLFRSAGLDCTMWTEDDIEWPKRPR